MPTIEIIVAKGLPLKVISFERAETIICLLKNHCQTDFADQVIIQLECKTSWQ